MNKKVSFFFIFFLMVFGYIFKIDKIVQIKFTDFSYHVKVSYKKFILNSSNFFSTYLYQANTIKMLREEYNKSKHYELLYKISRYELAKLEKVNFLYKNNRNFNYVEVLSYKNPNDFSKVILNTSLTKPNDIFALATINGYSAGIVINEDNENIAFLNPNEKCNYAVFIGKNKAPGITSGQDEQHNIIIKHIPKWYKINIGDEVITSGMDDIFPQGLKLGIVNSIQINANTKSAFIKPFQNVLNKRYFYIIKK
jgi:rod shape-determining protein MreC